MDKNRSELFGQFTYDDSLTYEELLVLEESLKAELQDLLLQTRAVHLDFTPMGDALMCQCAYESHDPEVYRHIAEEAAHILPQGITGRLLCLDKNLATQHLYWIARGQWQEKEYPLPSIPPAGLQVRHVELQAETENTSDD